MSTQRQIKPPMPQQVRDALNTFDVHIRFEAKIDGQWVSRGEFDGPAGDSYDWAIALEAKEALDTHFRLCAAKPSQAHLPHHEFVAT